MAVRLVHVLERMHERSLLESQQAESEQQTSEEIAGEHRREYYNGGTTKRKPAPTRRPGDG